MSNTLIRKCKVLKYDKSRKDLKRSGIDTRGIVEPTDGPTPGVVEAACPGELIFKCTYLICMVI
jgi:hypothetical protein